MKENLIREYKQKLFLDNLYKQNTTTLNNYFSFSGRIEKGKRFKIISNGNI